MGALIRLFWNEPIIALGLLQIGVSMAGTLYWHWSPEALLSVNTAFTGANALVTRALVVPKPKVDQRVQDAVAEMTGAPLP